MLLNRAQVERYATDQSIVQRARLNKAASRSAARTTVFLSHSHRDSDLVGAVINLLVNEGVRIYVDWMDEGMPTTVSPATAARIRIKIRENRKFVMLATERSLSSRWVPWELGCADGVKGTDHMAILRVEDRAGSWPGNEYVGLYPRIERADSGRLAVFPAGENEGVPLQSWLEA